MPFEPEGSTGSVESTESAGCVGSQSRCGGDPGPAPAPSSNGADQCSDKTAKSLNIRMLNGATVMYNVVAVVVVVAMLFQVVEPLRRGTAEGCRWPGGASYSRGISSHTVFRLQSQSRRSVSVEGILGSLHSWWHSSSCTVCF